MQHPRRSLLTAAHERGTHAGQADGLSTATLHDTELRQIVQDYLYGQGHLYAPVRAAVLRWLYARALRSSYALGHRHGRAIRDHTVVVDVTIKDNTSAAVHIKPLTRIERCACGRMSYLIPCDRCRSLARHTQ